MIEVKRLLPTLLRYVPFELHPKENQLLETLLSAGTVGAWADLSLRRSGYGAVIDQLLNFMLTGIRNQSIEDIEKEIAPYEVDIRSAFDMFIELGAWLANDSSAGMFESGAQTSAPIAN
jgi:hypothetical protein